MKVLSTSSIGGTWTKKFTCSECKSKLEVSKEDLVVINNAVFYAGETWEPEIYYHCPVCMSSNCVTDSVPSGIRTHLISVAASKYND